jgi:uncharacterized RDD family membrane protein YckC
MTRLTLETPEEVKLVFDLASPSRRLFAFAFDIALIVLSIAVVSLLALALIPNSGHAESQLLGALITLFAFLVWNFYFVATELRWQGRTLGKRLLGLRVIARDGGPLSADLVLARNLTRDVETLLPLLALLQPETLGLEDPLYLLICSLWLLLMPLLPLLNQYRARLGDLVAGTIVVEAPTQPLLADLVQHRDNSPALIDEAQLFSERQLDLYGIKELQLLEELLRRHPHEVDHQLLAMVAERIKKKIGWSNPQEELDTLPFLQAFYAAQRARLEHKLLFGTRQEEKRG